MAPMTSRTLLLFFISCHLISITIASGGWENGELEMFDLVEEVGRNFYEVFELPQDASLKEIKSAYRKLSVKFHPDKNPDPDAATQFRQIVGIYEVLKDPEIRSSYHRVLEDGLPNWKQPIYYYRRYRKLSIWQVVLLVTVLVSAAQYLAAWASYLEKSWSFQEVLSAKLRQKTRKRKQQKEAGQKVEEELKAQMDQFLEKPSLWNILPFQTLRFGKYLVTGFPRDVIDTWKEHSEAKAAEAEAKRLEEEEEEAAKLAAEEPRKPKKRKVFVAPEKGEGDDETVASWNPNAGDSATSAAPTVPVVSGGLWTDEDIGELAKLCSKFPGGTPKRWEVIAEFLGRPVPEVTFMAKKVLDGLKKAAPASSSAEEADAGSGSQQLKVKVKTKGGKADAMDRVNVENWSAEEQKALESALATYPKGSSERWEKISGMIPGRTKEECMQRFKYVADLVKKKREEEALESEATTPVPAAAPIPETSKSPAPAPKSAPVILEAPDEPELDESYYTKTRGKKGSKASSAAPAPSTKGLRKRDLRRQQQNSSSESNDSASEDWCIVEEDND